MTFDRAEYSRCINRVIAGRTRVKRKAAMHWCKQFTWIESEMRRRYEIIHRYHRVTSVSVLHQEKIQSVTESGHRAPQRGDAVAHSSNSCQSSVLSLESQSGHRRPSGPLAKTDWEHLVKKEKNYGSEFEYGISAWAKKRAV